MDNFTWYIFAATMYWYSVMWLAEIVGWAQKSIIHCHRFTITHQPGYVLIKSVYINISVRFPINVGRYSIVTTVVQASCQNPSTDQRGQLQAIVSLPKGRLLLTVRGAEVGGGRSQKTAVCQNNKKSEDFMHPLPASPRSLCLTIII